MDPLPPLLDEIRRCTRCAPVLPHGVRPVLQAHRDARVLLAGQAPGRQVHASGVPFDDASGERLRDWLGLSREVFHDARRVAIVPMGFCYPGPGASGDRPPRPECAPAWRAPVLAALPNVRLLVAIGRHAIDHHLPHATGPMGEIVRRSLDGGGDVIALPHPSPRNNGWLARHAWFERELLPHLRARVAQALRAPP